MDNVFSYIVFACQKGIQESSLAEDELAEQWSMLACALFETNLDRNPRLRIIGEIENISVVQKIVSSF